ncbi:hypothetical protein ID866_11273 [Astraeus odoratus]|nr:hypothetical protein ID866_11273 [Astraeus odoratus]
MSSPHHTSSPYECCLAKTKAPKEHMEEEWKLVSKEKRAWEEAECLTHEEAVKKVQEKAERKVEEEHRAQEEAVRAREEAERLAKEAAVREEVVKRVVEAVEERADTERRAVKEHLWEAVGQQSEMVVASLQVAKPSRRMTVVGPSALGCRVSGVQDPCTRCCSKGTSCMLSTAKEKTMACEVCHHAKVSYSWMKKTTGESRKWKWMWRSKKVEEVEVVDVDKEQPHFVVLQHLVEEHQDALRALTMTLDTLSTDFLKFQ